MIQKTTQRQLNAALGVPMRAARDGPEAAVGHWVRNRHYSLEVTQHPLRARMCGFGDKDRRPLAPAAVAKMTVRTDDDSPLDIDDVNVDFFVVTVDLWSADGSQEMNLVLHPSSSDRYLPAHAHAPKARRRSAAAAAAAATALSPARPAPYPAPSSERLRPPTNHAPPPPAAHTLRPIEQPPPAPTFPPAYPFPAPPPPAPDPFDPAAAPVASSSSASASSNTWAPYPPPTLPSIHSLGHASPPAVADAAPDLTPFRAWAEPAPPPLFDADPAAAAARWAATEPPFALPALPALPDAWSLAPPPPAPHAPPAPPPAHAPPAPHTAHTTQHPPPALPHLPRHTYTRTLVGPLCANAQRLQDEHRKPGIFFLFQDLSIRTEGTFRLRMRLMNVGTPPAPNGLANAVHTGASPVLAQVFTEPFTVYSAKRFPGVPDTTALSIAFGNQGQKLPLRNRHGPGKQQRRPLRPGGESSDDDSS